MAEYGLNKIFVEGKSDKIFIDFILNKSLDEMLYNSNIGNFVGLKEHILFLIFCNLQNTQISKSIFNVIKSHFKQKTAPQKQNG